MGDDELRTGEVDAKKDGIPTRPSAFVESSGISGAHCFSCKFSGGLISLIGLMGGYAIAEGTATKEEIDELVDYVLLAEEDTGDFRVKGMFLDQPVTVPQEDRGHAWYAASVLRAARDH